MKLTHFLVALLCSSTLVLGQFDRLSPELRDRVCSSQARCAAFSDVCKGYSCGQTSKRQAKEPECIAEGQKCYSKDDCCDYLECNLGAKNKADKVCFKPCVDLHADCRDGLSCCDKKAECREKSVTEKVCYKDSKKREICENVVYKKKVCEYPPCVPALGECSGGKHCCEGLECQAQIECRDLPCSKELQKKNKCPYPECYNAYKCKPKPPPPPPAIKCPERCQKHAECCKGYQCRKGWCKK